MSAKRRFDHEEARQRYANGEKISALAAEYGVTYAAVFHVVKPGVYQRMLARGRAYSAERWIGKGVCEECGGPMNLHSQKHQGVTRCQDCASKAKVKVRDGKAYCPTCDTWKPLEDFSPSNTSPLRGVHMECKSCQAIRKREWRKRNRDKDNATTRTRRRRIREALKNDGGPT